MLIRRHFLLAATGLATAGLATAGLATTGLATLGRTLIQPASAAPQAELPPTDPRLGERAMGRPDAPVTVVEYFSLTCTHCAAFAKDVFPQIQTKLIDTGKLRYVFRDFPLDQVALLAAEIARSLPPDRYEPFVMALFNTQDRWAFNRDANPQDELAKMAALAGMPRSDFDAVVKDAALKKALVARQSEAEKTFGIDSTPTFLFSGPKARNTKHAGELSEEAFARYVSEVS